MDLLQLLTNKDKLDYSENYNYDNNFIGTRLFPQEKTNNLKVSIARLVENGSVPVMAQFHALDSEARIGDRTNYKEIEVEKLLIKEKLNQGERIAYYLNGVTDNDTVRDFIFDDANNLVSRVLTRAELANMQLMGYGRLEINENNFKAVIDYVNESDELRNKIKIWMQNISPDIKEREVDRRFEKELFKSFESNLRITLIIDESTQDQKDTLSNVVKSFKLDGNREIEFKSYIVRLEQQIGIVDKNASFALSYQE